MSNITKGSNAGLFGKHLRVLRVMNGQTQIEMAKALGVSSAYLSLIENVKRLIPYQFDSKVIETYGLTGKNKKDISESAIKQNKEYFKKQLEQMYNEQKKESVYKYRDCNKSKKVRGTK